MRKKSITSIILLIIFSIIFLFNNVFAGIYTEENDGTKVFISNGKLKEISEDGGMIMNSKTGEFIYYNPDRKIFTQGKISEFCAAMANMMKKMMEALPQEYRQMMGMNEKQEPSKVKIVSEGDGGKIAGYKTVKYKILADGKLHEEIWLVEDASLVKEFKSLVAMLTEFEKCNSKLEIGSAPVELSAEYISLMEKGLTLKSIQYEFGEKNEVVNTVKLEIKDIPDSEFKVPAGYKKMSMTDYFGSEMEGME